jgi:hypothetical protein
VHCLAFWRRRCRRERSGNKRQHPGNIKEDMPSCLRAPRASFATLSRGP